MSNSKKSSAKGKGRNSRSWRARNTAEEKDPRRSSKFQDTSRDVKGSNHISWYSNDKQLLIDAASHAFSNATGARFNVFNTESSVPGIIAMNYIPGPGLSVDNSSHINIAAQRIYSFIRHQNSGHANYDTPDLMLYFLAMDSVYATWAHLVRGYGIANVYAYNNRYLPNAILESLNFNAQELVANLANFRYQINVLAAKISAFFVPSTMSIYNRHFWLNSNVFKDENIDKSQFYVFNPEGYYVFESNTDTSGGKLTWHVIEGPLTTDEWIAIVTEQLNALILDEDMQTMSGDILKAYGSGNLFSIPSIAENYTIFPVYDPAVLTQIQNATILGSYAGDGDIYQNPNTNAILYRPRFHSNPIPLKYAVPFTLPSNNPTPEDVMIASRLTVCGYSEMNLDGTSGSAFYRPVNYGTEIVTDIDIVSFATVDGQWTIKYDFYSGIAAIQTGNSLDRTGTLNALKVINLVSKFNFHPGIRYISVPQGGITEEDVFDATTVLMDLIDYDNVTDMSNGDLYKLHQTALFSEFGINTAGVISGNTQI